MNKKLPVAKDYEDIEKNAAIAASFVEHVGSVVPPADWTPELRRLVHTWRMRGEIFAILICLLLLHIPSPTATVV